LNLLRQERLIVLLALAGVSTIAWLYLYTSSAQPMDDMPGMAMPFETPTVFAMWWVMMLAMMLPSAAPMDLTFTALQKRKQGRSEPYSAARLMAGTGLDRLGHHVQMNRFAITPARISQRCPGRRRCTW
jgi:predicted metal-binding membrane protein